MLGANTLRRLQRLPRGGIAPSLRVDRAQSVVAQLHATGSQLGSLSTSAKRTSGAEVRVNGIALRDLAHLPRDKLVDKYGSAKLNSALKSLPKQLDQLTSDAASHSPAFLKQIFSAAEKCNATRAMLTALDALHQQHSSQERSRNRRFFFDRSMYNALYNTLQRANDRKTMLQVFRDFKTRAGDEATLPEVVYRFGIMGKFGENDLESVEELVREMRACGVPITSEVWSLLMLGYAKAEHVDRALQIFRFILNNSDVTKLHESDMNRVILALGCANKPDLAFEFYRECQTPLSATVFNALLSVCIHNNAEREAIAIMQNRSRFGLSLDAVGYSRVLEALERFNKREDIVHILLEMRRLGLQFGSKVKNVISRNREYLRGTPFARKEEEGVSADELVPELHDALSVGDTCNAIKVADALVSPMSAPADATNHAAKTLLRLGATRIRAEDATDAIVEAYLRGAQMHKVESIVRGLLVLKPRREGESKATLTALRRLLEVYSSEERLDLDQAHNVVLAMLHHAQPTSAASLAVEVDQILNVLEAKQDSASATQLLNVLVHLGSTMPESLSGVVDRVLGLLVRAESLKSVYSALDAVQEQGISITQQNYVAVVAAMNKANDTRKSTEPQNELRYTAADVQHLWEDCRRRGVVIQKALVATSAPWLAGGDATQRRLLWDAFHSTSNNSEDPFIFRLPLFETMLEIAVREHSSVEAGGVYDMAVAALTEAKSGVPSGLLETLISKLLDENLVDEAVVRLQTSATKPQSSAIVSTLKAIVDRDIKDTRVLQLIDLLHTTQKRGLEISTAWMLVETAQRTGTLSGEFASRIVSSFEFRRLKSEHRDAKTWKSIVKNARGLDEAIALYEAAKTVSAGGSAAEAIDKRLGELYAAKEQWGVKM